MSKGSEEERRKSQTEEEKERMRKMAEQMEKCKWKTMLMRDVTEQIYLLNVSQFVS